MLCNSNQGILGPSAEPVHRTPTEEPRELQGTATELLSNLVGVTYVSSVTLDTVTHSVCTGGGDVYLQPAY